MSNLSREDIIAILLTIFFLIICYGLLKTVSYPTFELIGNYIADLLKTLIKQ